LGQAIRSDKGLKVTADVVEPLVVHHEGSGFAHQPQTGIPSQAGGSPDPEQGLPQKLDQRWILPSKRSERLIQISKKGRRGVIQKAD
jgi:hypothetical protein